ncbi:MAG TPA: metalloregulator ArsR/SmtB family transcription factor [Gemmatimonadaceae bacterium]|nr:metalloregulator ArsR/SmtB family transcription factor [Gemmatimonadaceae bacterium]
MKRSRKPTVRPAMSDRTIERAARLLAAAGDPARLRMLEILAAGERDVGGLADALDAQLSTISQRLRLLRTEGLVAARRDGKHVYYALADHHVRALIHTVLAHADHEASAVA